MERRRQLDAVGAEGLGEVEPLLDGEIGVRVAALAGRELLEGGGEHADRHVDGLEWFGLGHGIPPVRVRDVGDRDGLLGVRADSIAAWRTRWVFKASAKSGSGTTGVPPPMTVRMSAAWLTKPCS